jgi:small multidrug resistance pump
MRWQALLFLLVAIVLELVGTTALKLSDGGAKPRWYALVAAGYFGAFYFFSLALRVLPVGIAYAIWAGIGIIGTVIIGRALFQQTLTPLAIVGIGLIVIGVTLVNVRSGN